MTAALTPQLALAYLGELSVDVRAAVVVASDGAVLAGDPALGARVAAAPRTPGTQHVPAADGTLLLVRTSTGIGIAVVAGDRALLPLLAGDLERIAGALVVPDFPS